MESRVSPDDMRFFRSPCNTDDKAAGIHIPVRSAQADEGRNDIDAIRIGNPFGNPFRIGSRIDETQSVTKPLDCRTGYEDRPSRAYSTLPSRPQQWS